ncbi:MAG: LEA type 2 family protein [Bacteroidales bacterium]|nr:LEA type 2 family protein [Bacteroidales bacterium]
MDKIKKAIFLLLLMMFSACAEFENIEVGDIREVKFKGFVDNTIAFTVVVPVTNPTNVKFRIKEVNVKTTVNGEYIGRIISDEVVIIPAKSDDEHTFLVKIHLSNILKGASTVIRASRNESMNVEINGYIIAKSYLMNKKIPINESRIVKGI